MIDYNKYRIDILDSRMDSIGGGGRRTKEPVDPQVTQRQYPPLNLFVTPGRVCDTFGEELLSLPTSRPKCSPVEASAMVVTTGAQRGAVPHLSTAFVQPSEQIVNHEPSVWSGGIPASRTSQDLQGRRIVLV